MLAHDWLDINRDTNGQIYENNESKNGITDDDKSK